MVLIMIAGAQKLLDPSSTSGALRGAGLPDAPILVRLLGIAEVVAGAAFLVVGGSIPAAAGAALYLGFAVFVMVALIKDLPISSCGCLGATETPPTLIHVVMNLSATAVLAMAVIIPVAPLGGLVGQEVKTVVPYILLLGASVYMLYALLTVLPLVSKKALAAAPTPVSRPRRVTR
jgi:hypothetical protein